MEFEVQPIAFVAEVAEQQQGGDDEPPCAETIPAGAFGHLALFRDLAGIMLNLRRQRVRRGTKRGNLRLLLADQVFRLGGFAVLLDAGDVGGFPGLGVVRTAALAEVNLRAVLGLFLGVNLNADGVGDGDGDGVMDDMGTGRVVVLGLLHVLGRGAGTHAQRYPQQHAQQGQTDAVADDGADYAVVASVRINDVLAIHFVPPVRCLACRRRAADGVWRSR